jgi:hypothetical protein
MTAQELARFLQILPASTNVYVNNESLFIHFDINVSGDISNSEGYDLNDCGDVVFDDWKHHTYTKIGNFLEDFDAVKQYFVCCKTQYFGT